MTSRVNPVAAYPVRASQTGDSLTRIEPIITPAQLQSRFLKNIPTQFKNDSFTSEDFQDQIERAISLIEIHLNLDIYPVTRKERLGFHRDEYRSFINLRTSHGPILEVSKLSITNSDAQDIYVVPYQWIDPGQFHYRQLNVIPMSVGSSQGYGALGLASFTTPFLSVMASGITWVPSYWEVEYTSGVCCKDGHVPMFINELIGIYAAIEIISQAQTAFTKTSVSISQDGLSQSTGGPGPAVFNKRLEDLEAKKAPLEKSIKKIFSQKFLTGYL